MILRMDMRAMTVNAKAFFRRYRPWSLVPSAQDLVPAIVLTVVMNQGQLSGFKYTGLEAPTDD